MKYREDKRSGNQLSILGFGCMRLPGSLGRVDIQKTEPLLLKAIEKGVNYFDTAYLYPGSEDAIGQIFEKHALHDKVFIATKLPHMMCKTYEDFDKYFDIQKKRLRAKKINYYFIHNISALEQWTRLLDLGIEKWIKSKKDSGEINQIGFSYHGSKNDFGLLLDAYDWDFCQIQYNYINTNYQAGVDGLKNAAKRGLPVFIMEPLLGGRLAVGLPKKAETIFKEQNSERSPASWAMKWLFNQPEVTLILSGMNSMEQLEDNINTADSSVPNMLSETEMETFDKVIRVFNESYKIPCTGCNYCMPCPKQINIPACFAAYNTSYSIGLKDGIGQYMISASGLSKTPHFVSDCIKCGKCESHCPQQIPIRESLTSVKRRLQPFYLKPALSLYQKFAR